MLDNLSQKLNSNQNHVGKLTFPEIVASARRMAGEGIVMLKNDGVLPIKDETVAVFGTTALNMFAVGYGSGGDVVVPYLSNLYDGLADDGVDFDKALYHRYKKWTTLHKNRKGVWGHWPTCNREMNVGCALASDVRKRASKAVIVLGRCVGESQDMYLKKGQFYLTDKEKTLINSVTSAFDKVCVVINAGNVIDLAPIAENEKVGAILYAWQGGMEGGNALADVLCGKVTPCGKLPDTIAKAYEDYPSSKDFGDGDFNNYVEDIYVGYRYFETFCPEKVLYPFGFGLSYTTFRVDATVKQNGRKFDVQAVVENTGAVAGKEVVQVYACMPCGSLGNAKKVLVGFAKTGVLQPCEKQALSIAIDLDEYAPFDDCGKSGHAHSYVFERGEYSLEIGTSSRDVSCRFDFAIEETTVVKTVEEQLAPVVEFERITNVNGAICCDKVPLRAKDLKNDIVEHLPKELEKCDEKVTFDDVLLGRYSVEQFVSTLTIEDLDDLSHGEGAMHSKYGAAGNAGMLAGTTKRLRDLGVPPIITCDGPSGIRIENVCALLPCGCTLASTFDVDGVRELYTHISRELAHFGVDVLLGPGMNIHRDHLCGRNFEYYSEDPCLTANIASGAVLGIQSYGSSACVKHFACNNQEYKRNLTDVRISERALREIYLKGFELAIKKANPHSIMTSYNKINGVWNHYNYELNTNILRGEWGYDGLVMTDWWMQSATSPEFEDLKDDAYRVRAQVDVLMPGGKSFVSAEKGKEALKSAQMPNGLTKAELQRTAINVLTFVKAQKTKNW